MLLCLILPGPSCDQVPTESKCARRKPIWRSTLFSKCLFHLSVCRCPGAVYRWFLNWDCITLCLGPVLQLSAQVNYELIKRTDNPCRPLLQRRRVGWTRFKTNRRTMYYSPYRARLWVRNWVISNWRYQGIGSFGPLVHTPSYWGKQLEEKTADDRMKMWSCSFKSFLPSSTPAVWSYNFVIPVPDSLDGPPTRHPVCNGAGILVIKWELKPVITGKI